MTAATPNRDAGRRREGNNNEVMKCFCWKKRLKRTGRRLSWEGGGGKTARGGGGDSGGGTGGHAQNQPRKKSNEASFFTSSCSSASVPVVSPTGVIAIAAVVLIGKPQS